MEDSFFGFDTSLPLEENGENGQIAEPSEEEYDALNDETFGSAINGDWEEAHEKLVRLTDNVDGTTIPTPKSGFSVDYDLEKYLSNVNLGQIDLGSQNHSGKSSENNHFSSDNNIWSQKPNRQFLNSYVDLAKCHSATRSTDNSTEFLCNTFSNTFQNEIVNNASLNSNLCPSYAPSHGGHSSTVVPKICTLEDIEKNIILQQKNNVQNQENSNIQSFRNENCQQHDLLSNAEKIASPLLSTSHNQVHKYPGIPSTGPPGFASPQSSPRIVSGSDVNLPRPLLGMVSSQPMGVSPRLPPGFQMVLPGLQHSPIPPHPLLNQHGFFPVLQRQMPNSHLPIALNNFAMHPNFNAMRPPIVSQNMLVQSPLRGPHPSNHNVVNNHQSNSTYNMFNMRLMQEIQQNHPLLQNNSRVPQYINQQFQQQRNGGSKSNHNRWDDGISNGNLPYEEFDKYANLMSTRDKHWLIGIQLSQLNTDTPYIDDFYYTVYKERKAILSGILSNSEAHKNNQLNHPLTQPKGNAQLILVQMGEKNGSRNGHRDRKNSEATGTNNGVTDLKAPYVFSPLKFENSLGKLQYGSVIAPRKIIDAEIMNNDTAMDNERNETVVGNVDNAVSHSSQNVCKSYISDMTTTTQKKSRYILLHIETLFRIVLKLEDLDNPNAVSAILLKKKKETERIAALEKLENANKSPDEIAAETMSAQMNNALKNKFAYEIEPKEDLIKKLCNNLNYDKIVTMMNIRKGKVLIKRILPYISDQEVRWTIWFGVFSSLQNILKKDRDDSEGNLYALLSDFRDQIKLANFEIIVKLSSAIPLKERVANAVFCSKFGISALVCLIIQAEHILLNNSDETLTDDRKQKWKEFLKQVSTTLNNTIKNQTICATIEPDSIQSLMNHLARFSDLKLESLLALITHAKQQIN